MDPFSEEHVPPKIVMIGGGGGNEGLLVELVQRGVDLTSINIAFDEGVGSENPHKKATYSNRLDLRRSLLALYEGAPGATVLHGALEYDSGEQNSLRRYKPGNLILAAFNSPRQSSEQVIPDKAYYTDYTGRNIPPSLERAELCASIQDIRIFGAQLGDGRPIGPLPRIRRIFFAPQVKANPDAVKAIMDADAIVLGPGDLYTCILPNLLPSGIVSAINRSRGTCMYITNLMTKLGETHGFKASDFVREVKRYLSPATLKWAIVNMTEPPSHVQVAYAEEGAYSVKPILSSVVAYVDRVLVSSLTNNDIPLRHDPKMTAEAILQVTEAGRSTPDFDMEFRPSSGEQK